MKKLICFVDLDGVVCDWMTPITKAVGKDMSIYEPYLHNTNLLDWETKNTLLGREAIAQVMSTSLDFWVNLPKFPWADELVYGLKSSYEVAFLTSPNKNSLAAQGKMTWQLNHYPDIPIIICREKYLVAAENKFLVDDDYWQLDRFIKAGGTGCLFDNQFDLLKLDKENLTRYINSISTMAEWIEKGLNYEEHDYAW